MEVSKFGDGAVGQLVPIAGSDPVRGEWRHFAFLPNPLAPESPDLSGAAYRAVGNARAALAALDSTARSLPNPTLFRQPTLRVEAQSTAALEGTYEPLARVLSSDEGVEHDPSLREVLNYLVVAEHAFDWVGAGGGLSLAMLARLQGLLMAGTRAEGEQSGQVRTTQVVIGRRDDVPIDELPVKAARHVPPPPGPDLEARARELLEWMSSRHPGIDPVVACALAHYEFEALHPFHDGNGRLGRLLIVVQLIGLGVLVEPTLSVSPWFEGRRGEYYDRLLAVSTDGDWSGWVEFFALGMQASADQTRNRMLRLGEVQRELKQVVADSTLRAASARQLVDFAVARPSFTVKQAQQTLGLSYVRTNKLIASLVELGVLRSWGSQEYNRRFAAPAVMDVLMASRH